MSIKPRAPEAAAAVEAPLPAATPALPAPAAAKAAEATVSGIRDGMEEATAAADATQVKMKQGMEKAMTTAESSFDDAMTTFKAMSSVKSLKDMFDLQASFARATLEKTMTESGKLTEASFKLTEQALAPITARVTLAVEKFAKAA